MTNITVDGEEFRNRKAQKCQHLKMQEKKTCEITRNCQNREKNPKIYKNWQKYQYKNNIHIKRKKMLKVS